ncbi:uncharacterized protein LOC143428173 [Xylocopa sonorina]|uniref:uncharacterized protein LOC143428173 n=1 Tax=Xylocopa sonorina TaxID=1818115 RepID=UPI00403AE390
MGWLEQQQQQQMLLHMEDRKGTKDGRGYPSIVYQRIPCVIVVSSCSMITGNPMRTSTRDHHHYHHRHHHYQQQQPPPPPPPPPPSIPVSFTNTLLAFKAVKERNRLQIAEIHQIKVEGTAKQQDCFPVQLFCHAEYYDDVSIVESERDKQSPQLSANFLMNHINAEQRRLVVHFLIRVGMHCRYPSHIVYESVKLFDAVMDEISVNIEFIQMTALASLWVALKRQENFHKIPTATMLVSHAKELYVGKEHLLLEYERKVLGAVNFNVTFANPFTLLAHHLIRCKPYLNLSDQKIVLLYNCGCYLIDLTLLDEQFCRTSINLIVLTVIELVFGLVLDVLLARPRWLYWRGFLAAAVPHTTIYRYEDQQIDQTRIILLRRLSDSNGKVDSFNVVYKKYNRTRYGSISKYLLERTINIFNTEALLDA